MYVIAAFTIAIQNFGETQQLLVNYTQQLEAGRRLGETSHYHEPNCCARFITPDPDVMNLN